jgi:hypothetical protein
LSALRDPQHSAVQTVSYESVEGCDGSDCLRSFLNEQGEMEVLPPHYHMFERGHEPEAGPRCYAIGFGNLPTIGEV